ncbi:MAG: transcription factor S [Caldivirga sp.]
MAIKFCPRCGSIMKPYKSGNGVVWKCPKCGYVENASTAVPLIEKAVIEHKPDEKPVVITKAAENLPKVKVTCPRCGNDEAYFWVQQTRAADEPPTRFYRCTRCGYTWREYE